MTAASIIRFRGPVWEENGMSRRAFGLDGELIVSVVLFLRSLRGTGNSIPCRPRSPVAADFMSLPDVSTTFRPVDGCLSAREKSQVQAIRLLFFLGTILCLLFIPLYALSSPDATDPAWMRVLVSILLAKVFGASYFSSRIRRNYATWGRGTAYVILGWFLVITALNEFRSDYEIGLLLLFSIFTVIAGIGARSIRPVLWFTGIGFFTTGSAVVVAEASLVQEAVLLGSMVTVALVLGIALQRLISTRKTLQERESRLRGLANSTPGVVFQFYARRDGTRGTYFISEHAEEVLGISADPDDFYERMLGRVPPSHREELLESIERVLDERTAWRYEFPFETPSGERLWLLGTSTPEVREGELVFNGLLLDITDRKKAEDRLRDAKKQAEESSRVKTAMLANMSHEVRTPLTSILGFSEMLQDHLEGQLKEFARQAHASTKHLSKTLESILQLSKLESGATALEREEFNLAGPVEETVESLRAKAEDKSLVLQSEYPDRGARGLWNENAIRRISRNLLENAIKFTPEGGRVNVRVERGGDEAILEVEDTGIGIDDRHLPHIFRAFRQESEGLGREYQGSGLGLSIVNQLVEEFGGTVEVETEKGEGTCFTVRLPMTGEEEASESGPKE